MAAKKRKTKAEKEAETKAELERQAALYPPAPVEPYIYNGGFSCDKEKEITKKLKELVGDNQAIFDLVNDMLDEAYGHGKERGEEIGYDRYHGGW